MTEKELAIDSEVKRRHTIVLNRARCGRCRTEIISRTRHHYVACPCGYLAVDGGRDYLKRICDEAASEKGEYRDFVDTSIISQTYSRRGLFVEAYRAGIIVFCTGPDGRRSTADLNDFVVYEAEGGATAWTPEDFFTQHSLQED